MRKHWCWIGLAALLPCRAEVGFNRDIRPIMADTCFRCHGPDKSSRMMGLRLDLRAEALNKTKTGVVPIVPGNPEGSAIVQRIFAKDARLMPPKSAHKDLSEKQKQTIRQWVAEGAKYEGHWAYQPVVRPAVPASKAANPVDAFILSRLEREGLQLSPEADKRTLLRRVSLDLTGLPPTRQEIADYLADSSPQAYDKVVDRLLATPRFAEKQAMHWLDAVRYADTCGFHGDNAFPAWPYRDYVLKSFRDNKPFDEFTREQLAGDLLPNATVEQKTASAYNRLNRTSAEGGIQPKEYLAKYGADRVRTTSAAWLGATMGCAECHDHKFDPILTKDFYAMKAFFADIKETGLVPDRGTEAWGALLPLPDSAQKAKLDELDRLIAGAKAAIPASASMPEKVDPKATKWRYQAPLTASSQNGSTLKIFNDETIDRMFYSGGSIVQDRVKGNGLIVASGNNPDNDTFTVTIRPGAGEWTSLGIEANPDESLPGLGLSRGADRFLLTDLDIDLGGIPVKPLFATSNIVNSAPEQPAMAAFDHDSSTGWGVATYLEAANPTLAIRFSASLKTTAESVVTIRLRFDSAVRRAVMGRFRLALASGDPIPDAMQVELARLEAKRSILYAAIPKIMASVATEPQVTRILPRGNWMDDSGAEVLPAVPEFLGKLETGSRRATRLDLANWIASKENPLTARVFVNRQWRLLFGAGLSKVLDDLGSQGELPIHLELLDWLAAEFMQPEWQAAGTHTWDMKHVIRSIVLSQTYRQSSKIAPALEERDPDNRLLARQSRPRVDAETVRDIALSVSGLRKDRFGGPSVKPVEPDGYLGTLNFPKREYAASRGDDLYRRGIYTFWQRSFLHPSMVTFDAPTREECTVNRANSNTPLQALVLLNDPIYVEAARVFAQNLLANGVSPAAGIEQAFEAALSRKPTPAERSVLLALHQKNLARFQAAPKTAAAFVRMGEAPLPESIPAPALAAMTSVTRAILNLHETITRN